MNAFIIKWFFFSFLTKDCHSTTPIGGINLGFAIAIGITFDLSKRITSTINAEFKITGYPATMFSLTVSIKLSSNVFNSSKGIISPSYR